MPNPALTPDERRIVEWLRGQSSTAQIKAEKVLASPDWLFARDLLAAKISLERAANAIESLAHRKAEDAAYRFWSDDQ